MKKTAPSDYQKEQIFFVRQKLAMIGRAGTVPERSDRLLFFNVFLGIGDKQLDLILFAGYPCLRACA